VKPIPFVSSTSVHLRRSIRPIACSWGWAIVRENDKEWRRSSDSINHCSGNTPPRAIIFRRARHPEIDARGDLAAWFCPSSSPAKVRPLKLAALGATRIGAAQVDKHNDLD
jgi:hypothetical protein